MRILGLMLIGLVVRSASATAQAPLAAAALLDDPAADATWYETGHGSFIRAAVGRQMLLRHPEITVRSAFDRYLVLRFFEPSGYPLQFDSVGLRAVHVRVAGRPAYSFPSDAVELYQVHHRWAVLLPLADTEIVSTAGRGRTVEFQVETTRQVDGAVQDAENEGIWTTSYRVVFDSPGPRLLVGIPVGLVGYRPRTGGSVVGIFPAGVAVGYRLTQSDRFHVDIAAAWLPGAVRLQDNDVFITVLSGGGFIDLGGWLYVGGAWVSDHRAGRSDPGAMALAGIGPTLVARLANLFGW